MLSILGKLIVSKVVLKKSASDYHMLQHYDVLKVDGVDKLICPVAEGGSVKYYVTANELFDILYRTHVSLGHGGRDRMCHEVHQRHKNITQGHIKIFLQFCEACEQKKSGSKKGVVVKPMVFKEFNSRGQLDLIDLQTQPDGPYKFLMVYQDHLTKFVSL